MAALTIVYQLGGASLVAQLVKKSSCTVGDMSSIPGLGRSAWRSKWQPTPIFSPGESQELRSLAGYSP